MPQPDTVSKPVDIIIPVYNALEDVQHCVMSLLANTGGHHLQLIIVNDQSAQETTQWLREIEATSSTITLIEHPQNTGYSGAVNTGLCASTSEYAVLLNSDTIVSESWLQGLIRCAESDPKIGIVSPVSNSAVHQSVPSIPDSLSSTINFPTQGEVDDFAKLLTSCSYSIYSTPPLVHGFCQFIKREVIDCIGLIDEELFPSGMGSELDYCFRAEDAGYLSAVAEDTFVFHSKAKSLGEPARLSSQWKQNLIEKYDESRFKRAAQLTADNPVLNALRASLSFNLYSKMQTNKLTHSHYNMAYLHHHDESLDVLERLIPLAMSIHQAGVTVHLLVSISFLDSLFHRYKHMSGIKDILVGYESEDEVLAFCQYYDVVACSHKEMLEWVVKMQADTPDILLAYLMSGEDFNKTWATICKGNEASPLDHLTVDSILLLSDSDDVAKQLIQNFGYPVYNVLSLFQTDGELSRLEKLLSFLNSSRLVKHRKQSALLIELLINALNYHRRHQPIRAFNKGYPPINTLHTLDGRFAQSPDSLRKRRVNKLLKQPHAFFADSKNGLLRPLRYLFKASA